MTDDKPTEEKNVPASNRPGVDAAPESAQPVGPSESALPVDGASTAPEAPAEPALAEPSPAEPARTAPAEPASTALAEPSPAEPEAQSKFAGPASTLGIRPSAEQSKAGSEAPVGLGRVAPPTTPPAGVANPDAARSAPPLAPPSPPPTSPSPPPAAVQPAPAPTGAPPGLPILPPPYPQARSAAPPHPATPEDLEGDEPVPTWAERLRNLSPALVTLSVGSIGALIFMLFAMTSHTTPVAVLLSAGVVVTLAFAADAVIASVATWRAAVEDEDPGRALLLAILAGGSAVVCAGALGATTVLLLVLNNL
jgi:hypothetical protein